MAKSSEVFVKNYQDVLCVRIPFVLAIIKMVNLVTIELNQAKAVETKKALKKIRRAADAAVALSHGAKVTDIVSDAIRRQELHEAIDELIKVGVLAKVPGTDQIKFGPDIKKVSWRGKTFNV
jgi:hypothetical protein